MKRRKLKNVVASVRQRLLNQARASGCPFNELLQYFAMERFLFRLSRSPHAEKFVLKGALMLATWKVSLTRPTMDIDLLGQVANDVEQIVAIIHEVCRQEVEPDGMYFDPTSVAGERIAEEAEYEGVRVRFQGNLGTARVRCRSTWASATPSCRGRSRRTIPRSLTFRLHGSGDTRERAWSPRSSTPWSCGGSSTVGCGTSSTCGPSPGSSTSRVGS